MDNHQYQFNTENWKEKQSKLLYSMDLEEATYNMPFDILHANNEFFSEVFEDNPVWEVYSELFKTVDRNLDLTILKEQGFSVPCDVLEIKQGSFMGDGLSFMHLTLMLSVLSSVANSSDRQLEQEIPIKRPFGQSVGDDLILIDVSKKECENFSETMKQFNMKASKVNSSHITGVFAEQYMMYVTDQRDIKSLPPESIFGDLWFIDSIKTMLLTGKSKVSSEKRNSFIGQSNALGKQLAYLNHPKWDWKRLRCRIYLWVFNYNDAIKIGRAMPHLPQELGGIAVPLGAMHDSSSAIMEEKYLPYFYSMLEMNQESFLGYYLLLKGIFKSTPKGVPWSNNPDRVLAICNTAGILHEEEVRKTISDIGPFFNRMGNLERLRYLSKTLGWVSASQIDEELSRRETYLKFWYEPEVKRDFKTLNLSSACEMHNSTWKFIRENVPRGQPKYYHRGDIFSILAQEFRTRLWGFFVHKEDPAISWIFEGVNSMHITFN